MEIAPIVLGPFGQTGNGHKQIHYHSNRSLWVLVLGAAFLSTHSSYPSFSSPFNSIQYYHLCTSYPPWPQVRCTLFWLCCSVFYYVFNTHWFRTGSVRPWTQPSGNTLVLSCNLATKDPGFRIGQYTHATIPICLTTTIYQSSSPVLAHIIRTHIGTSSHNTNHTAQCTRFCKSKPWYVRTQPTSFKDGSALEWNPHIRCRTWMDPSCVLIEINMYPSLGLILRDSGVKTWLSAIPISDETG